MRDLQTIIRLSCLLEASARKAGNVHPGVSFDHLSYADFVRSADAAAPALAKAPVVGVGQAVLEAVAATRSVCDRNTNLGIILLIAPLAAVSGGNPLSGCISTVLDGLKAEDAEAVYEAIRIASPRGLGSCDSADVAKSPTGTLREVMSLAADRDLIASEYASGFRIVLESSRWLASHSCFADDWESTIQHMQVLLMATYPDTDIERKCGRNEAVESYNLARDVLSSGFPDQTTGQAKFVEFDAWLRDRGSLRNPGTTADLVTASLFAAIRDDLIEPPSEAQIHEHAARISQTR